ncbi:MAG: hypothetical protein LUE98_13315 [Tannerellaceae bacterium]|nr:hypothetical protein [Tannerellaceae bacterium]
MTFRQSLIYSVFLLWATGAGGQSLDEIDRLSYDAGKSPAEMRGESMSPVNKAGLSELPAARTLSLSGEWLLAEENAEGNPDWKQGVPAEVPGSIHSALVAAGKIPDPMVDRNDILAEQCSYRCWWMKRVFTCEEEWNDPVLLFEGVANRCKVWLNGQLLGEHEGMFGGPDFEVKKCLRKGTNELVVLLDSIPQVYHGNWPATANEAWKYTVVANCVYGWHYAKIPSLGIWQPVQLKDRAPVRIEHPFVITRSVEGDMRLALQLAGEEGTGTLQLSVSPVNFTGETQYFEYQINRRSGDLYLDFTLENPALWWPNGLGEPSLYKADILLTTKQGVTQHEQVRFGVRTVEMAPLPGGERPDKYNWTFVINKRPLFVKGTGWCTMDALLDFSRERYERFLTLAKEQHIQMLRAWGEGLPRRMSFMSCATNWASW